MDGTFGFGISVSAAWISIAISGSVAVAGLWLANSISRRTRAEQQIAAINKRHETYPLPWKMIGVSTAANLEVPWDLSREDRAELYNKLSSWLTDHSGGLLLGEVTQTLYLCAMSNLVASEESLWPPSVAEYVRAADDRERARSKICRRQLSLLRTAMRAELGMMGGYRGLYEPLDRDFLCFAGVRLWQRPW